MKILLTVHQFLPDYSAGTEVLTYETAQELRRRGHEVEVWAGFPSDYHTALKNPISSYTYNGIPVQRYHFNPLVYSPNRNNIEYEYNNIALASHFYQYIEASKPDLVHFFHLMSLSASPVEVCLRKEIPCVLTPTDFWIICPACQLRLPDQSLCLGPEPDGLNCIRHRIESSPGITRYYAKLPDGIYRMLTQAILNWPMWPFRNHSVRFNSIVKRQGFVKERVNRINGIFVPTRFMEKMLVQNGIDPSLISFVPYGLNMKPFEKGSGKKPSKKIRIGFIGTLYIHKGPHILLEAVKMLPKDLPIEVKVYGNLLETPDYVRQLIDIADGDERIRFCGRFQNERIGEVFSEIDVLAVPSIWYENTPLVIYSAHASGTPVIATNLGGMAEVVHHEKNGLLFERGNAAELARLLRRVVEEKDLLSRLSRNIVPPPSMTDYVDQVEKIYSRIVPGVKP
jgi:glycosyltransferase involved in cell wall biosynthesis